MVLGSLLPALCGVVAVEAEGGDARFFCLRMVSDILQLLLTDEQLYLGPQQQQQQHDRDGGGGADGQQQQRPRGSASAAIDGVLRAHILPLVPALLRDEDPMPLYALKVRCGWCGVVWCGSSFLVWVVLIITCCLRGGWAVGRLPPL